MKKLILSAAILLGLMASCKKECFEPVKLKMPKLNTDSVYIANHPVILK